MATGGLTLRTPPSVKTPSSKFGEIWAKIKKNLQQFENFWENKKTLSREAREKIGFWSDTKGKTVQNTF